MVKKKKTSPDKVVSAASGATSLHQDANQQQLNQNPSGQESTAKTVPPFKNPLYLAARSGQNNSKKSRNWKSLKQILAGEKPASGQVFYASLDAHPSKRPAKKYSDLSGVPAKYKDPCSKLLYHNIDEFAQIRMLSNDVINGYLELRKANE